MAKQNSDLTEKERSMLVYPNLRESPLIEFIAIVSIHEVVLFILTLGVNELITHGKTLSRPEEPFICIQLLRLKHINSLRSQADLRTEDNLRINHEVNFGLVLICLVFTSYLTSTLRYWGLCGTNTYEMSSHCGVWLGLNLRQNGLRYHSGLRKPVVGPYFCLQWFLKNPLRQHRRGCVYSMCSSSGTQNESRTNQTNTSQTCLVWFVLLLGQITFYQTDSDYF